MFHCLWAQLPLYLQPTKLLSPKSIAYSIRCATCASVPPDCQNSHASFALWLCSSITTSCRRPSASSKQQNNLRTKTAGYVCRNVWRVVWVLIHKTDATGRFDLRVSRQNKQAQMKRAATATHANSWSVMLLSLAIERCHRWRQWNLAADPVDDEMTRETARSLASSPTICSRKIADRRTSL